MNVFKVGLLILGALIAVAGVAISDFQEKALLERGAGYTDQSLEIARRAARSERYSELYLATRQKFSAIYYQSYRLAEPSRVGQYRPVTPTVKSRWYWASYLAGLVLSYACAAANVSDANNVDIERKCYSIAVDKIPPAEEGDVLPDDYIAALRGDLGAGTAYWFQSETNRLAWGVELKTLRAAVDKNEVDKHRLQSMQSLMTIIGIVVVLSKDLLPNDAAKIGDATAAK